MAAALVAAVVPVVTLLVPATPASAAGFTITTDLPASYPRQVPLAGTGQTTRISVVVTTSEPVTLTAFSEDDTLAITDPERSLGATGQPTTVSFGVAARTPGFHQLDVEVDGTAPPYASAAVSFGYVWTTGSPLFPGTTISFAGLTYGWQGTEHVAGLDSSTRAVRMLTILDGGFAYVGLPAHGRPTCTAEGNGCLRYAFDTSTRLLQVGTSIIGRLERGVYLDGLVPAADGELYGQHVFGGSDQYLEAKSLSGTYKYSSTDYPSGLTYEKVTFRKDGSYSLAYVRDGGKVRKLAGSYRVGNHGKVTFRSARGVVVQRGTILRQGRTSACVLNQTCLRAGGGPYDRGIWLILSGRKATHPDGNLLQPVR